MPDDYPQLVRQVLELADKLPIDPAAFAVLSKPKRNRLITELETIIVRLNKAAAALEDVREPQHVFDPTAPKVIGQLIASHLLLQSREKLTTVADRPFYGAGVYALYYTGDFDCYAPVSNKEHPIYVGKADPEDLHAATPKVQGQKLFTRLKDHRRSLSNTNLQLGDFECRYLVVRSAWVKSAEDHLIHLFKPVWNKEMKVCFGFGKHGDSPGTRKNARSPWDTLHSGRAWATTVDNTPNARTVTQIKAAIAEHYKKNPPVTATPQGG